MKSFWAIFINILLAIGLLTGCSLGKDVETADQNKNDQSSTEVSSPVEPKTYETDQGNEIEVPFGAKGFASKVIDFIVGDPAPSENFSNPEEALGEPDYEGTDTSTWKGFISLGGGGQIVLEFESVYLVDGPGDDLAIFEVGPAVETMAIEISADGVNWISVGEISGGIASVDIGPYVSKNEKFSFVKLIDLKTNTSGSTPGADLDAIAVLNGALE